eukprot:gene18865-19190_t
MPPFVVGNIKWDNWLLSELLIRNLTSVIDVTKTCFAAHVGMTKKYVRDRPGFVHNEELWKISRFGSKYIGLGSVSYAGFYTNGTRLLPQNNEHANLVRMLFSQLHRSGFLFVVTVARDQLMLLDNWMCWAERIRMKKFLIFAMDNVTRSYAESRRLLTYYPQENRLGYPVLAANFEKMPLDDKLYVRARFLYIILRAGISFVSLYSETIFLSDPPLKVQSAGDVLTLKSPSDKSGQSIVSDHLLGLTSSEDGLDIELTGVGRGERFIKKVLKCFDFKKEAVRLNQSSEYAADVRNNNVYQSCLTDIYFHEVKLKDQVDEVLFNFLDLRVASGSSAFFESNLPQSNGFTPSMVAVDANATAGEKVKLLRDWHLWLRSNRPTNASPSSWGSFMQYCRGSSPKKSHFAIVNNLPSKWRLGSVSVQFFNATLSVFDLWVRPLRTSSSSGSGSGNTRSGNASKGSCRRVLMPLDDNVRLSPSYYQWSRQVLLKYDPEEHAELYGFSMQRQRLVLGVPKLQSNPWVQYLDRQVDRRLTLFSYQLTSSWGQFYFPQHWNAFARWFRRTRRMQPDFVPCVPYFFSNRFLLKPNQMWTLWFNYYAFFHGLYSLYLTYPSYRPDESAEYGLLVVNRVDVDSPHVRTSQFADLKLVNESVQLNLAPLPYYPVFDFFFQKVDLPQVLRDRWRFVSHVRDPCVTNDNHFLKKIPSLKPTPAERHGRTWPPVTPNGHDQEDADR